ncbi:MAG: beta-propeller domain-containing protein, partial [Nannocystaceae bacterium]|nr:beta-propeller domain-containing protein [Nannocystaceae bacterium]
MLIVGACIVVPAFGNGSEPGPGEAGFVADNPNAGRDGDDGQTGAAGEDGGEDDNAGEGGDPERAISEADIVHIEGDRLYALSAFGGLTIIDVSNPDHMLVLGRHRAQATPFEMYVEDGQVFVIYSDYGSYSFDEALGGYVWRSSSKLVALDATDPADVVVSGEFDLPGRIQDSRRVGEILYLVTHEDGYCWGCESRP